MTVTRAAVAGVQDQRNVVEWYFLLKYSPYLTAPLLRLGVSANATTIIWGVLNLGGAALVYLAIAGHLVLVPAIFLLFLVSEILDTSDGEIARYTGTANPISGKLLDGVCHKVTEFALLTAFVCGAHVVNPGAAVLPIGLILLSGEGIYSYCYERRLLILRVHMQSGQKAGSGRPITGTYAAGALWRSLPMRQKIGTLIGLVSYKSIYGLIIVAIVLPAGFTWVLAALAVYKHVSWIRLLAGTLRLTPRTLTV